jgi:hypothetical protein
MFKDISNRLGLPKADVGRLFAGRSEAGAGGSLPSLADCKQEASL